MKDDLGSGGRRELYRDIEHKKICGVCAGIANYFNIETWLVRVITVSAFLWFNIPILIAYCVACFVMEPKPRAGRAEDRPFGPRRGDSRVSDSATGKNGKYKPAVSDVWRSGNEPSQVLQKVSSSFEQLDYRLRDMEEYVTSKRFKLQREINRME